MNSVTDQVFAALYPYLPYFIGVLVVTTLLKSAKFKGWIGERLVHRILKWRLDSSEYTVFHDVLLPSPNGTAQIDHLVLSRYGVFVIETKNYSGWIYGSERQKQWTRTGNGRRDRFQNPLHQNYGHMKAVEAATGLPFNQLVSMVVFTGSARFKTELPGNVMRLRRMANYIAAHKDPVIDPEELSEAIKVIVSAKQQSTRKAARKHAAELRRG